MEALLSGEDSWILLPISAASHKYRAAQDNISTFDIELTLDSPVVARVDPSRVSRQQTRVVAVLKSHHVVEWWLAVACPSCPTEPATPRLDQ